MHTEMSQKHRVRDSVGVGPRVYFNPCMVLKLDSHWSKGKAYYRVGEIGSMLLSVMSVL